MSGQSITSDAFRRYLRVLRVERRDPSLSALGEIVSAHQATVPFENISKLCDRRHHRLRSLPEPESFLDRIERFNCGGTCYTNNYYLYALLAHLDYEVRLCGAQMSRPDVHLVSIVTLDRREYLVDVGYAAPFFIPLPRDLSEDISTTLGRDRYVLKPQDEEGRSRIEHYEHGVLKHGYRVDPRSRRIEEFDAVIASSFDDDATFMNAVRLVRFLPGRSIEIMNLSFIESRGTRSRFRRLSGQGELEWVIAEEFGIPPELTRDALEEIESLGGRLSPDSD